MLSQDIYVFKYISIHLTRVREGEYNNNAWRRGEFPHRRYSPQSAFAPDKVKFLDRRYSPDGKAFFYFCAPLTEAFFMAKNKFFSTKTMVSLALFTALGYGLSFLEFPIFPATPFLKLDFTNVVTLLAGYMFGVGGAFVVELCKQLLIFLTHSDTAGVGQIANLIMTMAFVLPPVIMYNRLKGKKWVAVGMVAGSVAQIVASLLCNRFITFPLYMGESAVAVFNSLWWYIVAFNAIKAVAISVLTFVLYKRLEFVLDKMFARRAKQEQESADEGDNSAE